MNHGTIPAGPIVYPGAYIHPDAIIGVGTTIHPHAVIYAPVVIGEGCIIGAGTVIGDTGFGYQRDDTTGHQTLREHTFRVVIEDDVHIGAHTCVDRGSWRDTVICEGARIDNHVHIGHNCIVGSNCMLPPGVVLGGSTHLGRGVWVGMNATVRERILIGDGAVIGMGAVVLSHVPAGQIWVGNPARLLRKAETLGTPVRPFAAETPPSTLAQTGPVMV